MKRLFKPALAGCFLLGGLALAPASRAAADDASNATSNESVENLDNFDNFVVSDDQALDQDFDATAPDAFYPPGRGPRDPYPGRGPRDPRRYPGRYPGRNPYNRAVRVDCGSHNYGYRRCSVGAPIRQAYLQVQASSASCRPGVDWGVDYDAIWVNNGCRATFLAYIW